MYYSAPYRIEKPSYIKDQHDIDAMDLYAIYQVLAFRMDEILIVNDLQEFNDNVLKMDEISRMTRKWSAQMADMDSEQIAAGLYVNDNGDLVSHFDLTTDNEEDKVSPLTRDLTSGFLEETVSDDTPFEPISNSLTYAFGSDMDMTIRYTINKDQHTGRYLFEFSFAVKAKIEYETYSPNIRRGSYDDHTTYKTKTFSDITSSQSGLSHDNVSEAITSAIYQLRQSDEFNHWQADDGISYGTRHQFSGSKPKHLLTEHMEEFSHALQVHLSAGTANSSSTTSTDHDTSTEPTGPIKGSFKLALPYSHDHRPIQLLADYQLFGNAIDGYSVRFEFRMQYASGDSITSRPLLVTLAMDDFNSFSSLINKAIEQLKDQYRDLEGYRSNVIEMITLNDDFMRQSLIKELYTDFGEEAEAIDALFTVSSLSEAIEPMQEGVYTVELNYNSLIHYIRINWNIDTDTNKLEYDAYISTDYSNGKKGAGWEELLLSPASGGEIALYSDDEPNAIWSRLFSEIQDDFQQTYAAAINDNGADNAFWKNLYGLQSHDGRKARTGRNNLDVARALLPHINWDQNDTRHERGIASETAWEAGFEQARDHMDDLFQTRYLDQLPGDLPDLPDLNTTSTSQAHSSKPLIPNDMGEMLEEAIGDLSLYQNGRAYSEEHIDILIGRFDDVISHIGNLNQILLSRIHRLQETATLRLQMIVQDLQKEYQGTLAITRNMN